VIVNALGFHQVSSTTRCLIFGLLTRYNYSFRVFPNSYSYSVNTMLRSLPLLQLDKTLTPWRSLPRSRPIGGWLRAVRQALGMTTRQLAKAVGVTQAAVVDAERTEAKGDITLTTLQRYAAALGCELTYALVPNRPLQEVVEERAERIAREIAELRRKLMEGKRSRLWQ
jgi:predicted DNA-binding mobile mystery protein A